MSEEEILHERKLKSKPSFNSKNSLARVNNSGHFSRPMHKVLSNDKDPGMTDKLHSLMDTYLPKDIPSIEKEYTGIYSGLSGMLNIPWLGRDLISRKVIATRQ